MNWTRRDILRLGLMAAVGPLLEACGRNLGLPGASELAPEMPDHTLAALKWEGLALPQDVIDLLRASSQRVTPNDAFYEQTYDRVPTVDASKWRLRVRGLVERPLDIGYDELRALPSVLSMRTLECIGNPVGGSLIGNAIWRGVSFGDLLRRAGVREGQAKRVIMASADNYETSVPLETALHSDSLLVYEMNGVPLPAAHGYPLRVLFPGRYGQKQPKWLTDVELSDNMNHRGIWERKGWSDDAFVQINSRIEVPRAGLPIEPGEQRISGVAFAGARPVTMVEVLANGSVVGTAELTRAASTLVWTQWSLPWRGDPGQWDIEVRATDGAGKRQEPGRGFLESVFPEGTSSMHKVRLRIEA
jgi:DMSO/TMAO reductase YedYZ molybdopterin-dependent catalytic subunit